MQVSACAPDLKSSPGASISPHTNRTGGCAAKPQPASVGPSMASAARCATHTFAASMSLPAPSGVGCPYVSGWGGGGGPCTLVGAEAGCGGRAGVVGLQCDDDFKQCRPPGVGPPPEQHLL